MPGCGRLTKTRYCEKHTKPYESGVPRPSAAKRGYGAKWQRESKLYLDLNPLCVECKKKGKQVRATVVDHIIPHRGDQQLFWDETNWQALCKRHHDQKTARGL